MVFIIIERYPLFIEQVGVLYTESMDETHPDRPSKCLGNDKALNTSSAYCICLWLLTSLKGHIKSGSIEYARRVDCIVLQFALQGTLPKVGVAICLFCIVRCGYSSVYRHSDRECVQLTIGQARLWSWVEAWLSRWVLGTSDVRAQPHIKPKQVIMMRFRLSLVFTSFPPPSSILPFTIAS